MRSLVLSIGVAVAGGLVGSAAAASTLPDPDYYERVGATQIFTAGSLDNGQAAAVGGPGPGGPTVYVSGGGTVANVNDEQASSAAAIAFIAFQITGAANTFVPITIMGNYDLASTGDASAVVGVGVGETTGAIQSNLGAFYCTRDDRSSCGIGHFTVSGGVFTGANGTVIQRIGILASGGAIFGPNIPGQPANPPGTGFYTVYADPTVAIDNSSGRYSGFTIEENDGPLVNAGGVPEPSAWSLLLIGFASLGAALRQRRARFASALT